VGVRIRGDLVTKLSLRCLTIGSTIAAVLALTIGIAEAAGPMLAVLTTAAIWWERRVNPRAEVIAEPALIAAGLLGAGVRQAGDDFPWLLAVTGCALLGLVLAERPLQAAAALEVRSANLTVRSTPTLIAGRLGTAILVLLALAGVALALRLPIWPVTLASVATGAVCAGAVAEIARRRLRPRSGQSPLARALRRHQPEFLIYFSAPPGSEYQIMMWLPYLERIGRPFLVLLREAEFLAPVAAATRAPVVVCPTPRAVDEAIVPSLRVAFYVNHGALNSHCIRFTQLTHIQLHHGDSDKAPSANPLTAIFDRIFVAGQAAIDRYERAGVVIPREKFVIVGRPQVEAIEVCDTHIRDRTDHTVLYTPTWTGHFADTDHCSLPIGEPLVRALLARGVTVILRAHPYTSQNPVSARQLAKLEEILAEDRSRTGRPHRWGTEATRKLSLVDCINHADALLSDVSGVISDFLFSGKPFAVTDMARRGDDFTRAFPLARAAYVVRADLSGLDEVLDGLLERDPLVEVRRRLRTEYLGDFPADRYAEAFLDAARRELGSAARLPAPRSSPLPTGVQVTGGAG
jgi:hypothetical protein